MVRRRNLAARHQPGMAPAEASCSKQRSPVQIDRCARTRPVGSRANRYNVPRDEAICRDSTPMQEPLPRW
jgi:hypothetical protein